jgi:cobyrinic acid a,c-diamide synthase
MKGFVVAGTVGGYPEVFAANHPFLASLERRYRTRQLLTGTENKEGYSFGNVLASYIHLSFAANPNAASHFVQHCRETRAVAQ